MGYSDESVKEMNESFKLRKTYIGGDGRLLSSCSIASIDYIMHNATGIDLSLGQEV